MSIAIKIGSTYKVNSSRKGKFTMVLTQVDNTWATGLIESGKAGAILPENEREQGEEITVRIDLCTFEPVEGSA